MRSCVHGNIGEQGIQQQADCLRKEDSGDAAEGSVTLPSTTGYTYCGQKSEILGEC
jgi:hypothetical protein